MPQLDFMGWNIENFGDTKYKITNGREELLTFVAEVIIKNNVAVAGFSEIRSNRAEEIGKTLVAILDRGTSGVWAFKKSDQFVSNRLEQYLFVWDTNQVNAGVFQHKFVDTKATKQGALIGFPRQATKDRPPYLTIFTSTATPLITVSTVIFHAPEPSFALNVNDGCKRLADIVEINNATEASIVMGDFNVKSVAKQSINGSPGNKAFSAIVAKGFIQALDDPTHTDTVLTSLKAYTYASSTMTASCYQSQPYDHIFVRLPTPNQHTIVQRDAGADELISDCLGGSDLGILLKALENKRNGRAPNIYTSVASAFVPFRRFVSDHLPVLVTLKWT